MDNILLRNIRHVSRNRVLAAVLLLGIGIALSSWLLGGGLILSALFQANRVKYGTLNIDTYGDNETVLGLHVPMQTISLTLPAGYYADTGLSYGTGEEETADYFLVTKQADGRILFILVDYETFQALANSPTHTFVGSLRMPTPDLYDYLEKEYTKEGIDDWQKSLTTYQLDTTRAGTHYGVLLLAMALAGFAGGTYLMLTGLRWLIDPYHHPVYRKLNGWGETDEAPVCIQREIDEGITGYYALRSRYLLMTTRWLVFGSAFRLSIHHSKDLLWVYYEQKSYRIPPIPLPIQTSSIKILFTDQNLRLPMNAVKCVNLIRELSSHYPDVMVGYSSQKEALWKQIRQHRQAKPTASPEAAKE